MKEELRHEIMNCVWDIQELSESIGYNNKLKDNLFDKRVKVYKRLLGLLHKDSAE